MEQEILIKIEVPGAGQAITSIENLTKANKALREERKKLDLDSIEGQARAKEINASLDANTKKITENTSALEKQRANIGNYTNSIKDAIPFYRQAEQATNTLGAGMGTLNKAFLATGIGLFIAALGSLIAYFKGSEEGQDRLAKITAVLGVAMDKVMVVIEGIGEAIFNTVDGSKSLTEKFGLLGVVIEGLLVPFRLLLAGLDKISEWTGLDKVIEDTIAAGNAIAEAQDQIESRENELIVKRAETNKRVQELREKAIKQEGDLKRATIQEAIDLEKALAAEEAAQLQAKLDAFDLEAESSGKLTEEQKKQRAEMVAAIIDAESQAASATIKFQKEIERINDDATKKRLDNEKKIYEQAAALADEQFKKDIERIKKLEEEKGLIKEQVTELEKENIAIQEEEKEEVFIKDWKAYKKSEEDKTRIATLEQQNRIGLASAALGMLKGLFKEGTIAYKALAIGQAVVDTYRAASAALAPPPVGAGPLFGPILAGTTIGLGLANVAKISGIQFRRGGIANNGGVLTGRSHAEGGIPFSVGGRLGFEAEGGEAIINKRSTAMFRQQLSAMNEAGGGVKFAQGGIPSFAGTAIARQNEGGFMSRQLLSAITQIRPVVTVEDINTGQNRVQVTEDASQVI